MKTYTGGYICFGTLAAASVPPFQSLADDLDAAEYGFAFGGR